MVLDGLTQLLSAESFVLDESKPDATVTALTTRGFEYRYDQPHPIGRAQWGTWCNGGECFELGFHLWRKVD